jgi:O-antigen/teichoic acid export membrane protein
VRRIRNIEDGRRGRARLDVGGTAGITSMTTSGVEGVPGPGFRRFGIAALLRSRLVAQAAGFAGSQVAVSLLAAVSTVLVARDLSTEGFGAQSFAISFLLFTAMFFDFGFALPVARLTAASTGIARRQMVATGLVVFAPAGALFSIAVFALSFGVDAWFHVDVAQPLRLIAGVSFVYPFTFLSNYLAQATDRLHTYSATAVMTQALYVAAIAVATVLKVKLTVALVLELRVLGMLLSSLVLVVWLSPHFRGCLAGIPDVIRGTRDYGMQAYLGLVMSMATYNMDVIMLGALTDAKTVGFYALAGSAAYTVILPVAGMAAALFPRMTSASRLDRRWLAFSVVSGLICASTVILLARPVIPWVFGHRYAPAVGLVAPLALAQAVCGVSTVYNTFMAAQGQGKVLRNAASILTGTNLILNFALIPPFGAVGAAWASFAALVVNLIAYLLLYRRLVRRAEPAPQGICLD